MFVLIGEYIGSVEKRLGQRLPHFLHLECRPRLSVLQTMVRLHHTVVAIFRPLDCTSSLHSTTACPSPRLELSYSINTRRNECHTRRARTRLFYNCRASRTQALKNPSHCSSQDFPAVMISATSCDTKAIMASRPFSNSDTRELSFHPLSRIPK